MIGKFFEKYCNAKWSSKKENIAFGDYPDPAFRLGGESPSAYLTILSEHINKPFDVDELWFAGMIGNYLKCKVFGSVSEYTDIEKKSEKYIENKETFKKLSKQEKFGSKSFADTAAVVKAYKLNQEKYKGMINKNITTGFLSIQKNIIAQLEFIL